MGVWNVTVASSQGKEEGTWLIPFLTGLGLQLLIQLGVASTVHGYFFADENPPCEWVEKLGVKFRAVECNGCSSVTLEYVVL